MKTDKFVNIAPNIAGNTLLRIPQSEGYEEIQRHYLSSDEREVGIVLPVGCGKSGLIAITPFALKSKRVLVIAPGKNIKKQLAEDFNPANPNIFYLKCNVITGDDFPEPAIIEGAKTNKTDLDESDVVVTNIQQIQGKDNKWLMQLPSDYFDLIIVDEAHHNVAESWNSIREHFPDSKIVNLSATPTRADGQIMEGDIIYSFPIFRAIENGYVKKLKAKVLNPSSLKYIRNDDGNEVEVSIEEVKRLGEEDSAFRRSIVSSEETLKTIIDCSIRELQNLRSNTGENRHKIIVSALNYKHCIQITEAYSARGLRAEYIHSQEDSRINQNILDKLERHELDVIVQVRMLGEGFDHPFLSVAAVCSIFSNLSPFAQFVGRVMRVVDQNQPNSPNNQGIVIYHAGANIAQRWSDFQQFSEADQEYFDQLLPVEELNFSDNSELELNPRSNMEPQNKVEISAQQNVTVREVPLLKDDLEAQRAIELLEQKGFEVTLKPIPVTKQKQRQAAKKAIDEKIKNKTGVILNKNGINPQGKELDKKHLGKTNFILIKSAIDKKCNELVGKKSGQRHEFSQPEIDIITSNLDDIANQVEVKLINGQ
ncbi:putative helicase [gamma proteobacterium IMCC1989]|nr:putative helicase [gamma proteobacterium IMCC1989]